MPLRAPLLFKSTANTSLLNQIYWRPYPSSQVSDSDATVSRWLATVTCWSNSSRNDMQFIVEIPQAILADIDLGQIADLIRETVIENLSFDQVEVKTTPLHVISTTIF